MLAGVRPGTVGGARGDEKRRGPGLGGCQNLESWVEIGPVVGRDWTRRSGIGRLTNRGSSVSHTQEVSNVRSAVDDALVARVA